MTTLSICQNAADELSLVRPLTIVGSADPTANKMLRLANKVGNSLMKRFDWRELRDVQTFTSVAQEEQTGLDAAFWAAFDRFIPGTFWDRTEEQPIGGPIDAFRWQTLKAEQYSNTYDPVWTRFGNAVYILPVPAAGKTYALEYITRNWAELSNGTPASSLTADDAISRLDEELVTLGVVYEWLMSEGLPWEMAYRSYQDRFRTVSQSQAPSVGLVAAGDVFGAGMRDTRFNPTTSQHLSNSYLWWRR